MISQYAIKRKLATKNCLYMADVQIYYVNLFQDSKQNTPKFLIKLLKFDFKKNKNQNLKKNLKKSKNNVYSLFFSLYFAK